MRSLGLVPNLYFLFLLSGEEHRKGQIQETMIHLILSLPSSSSDGKERERKRASEIRTGIRAHCAICLRKLEGINFNETSGTSISE